MNWGTELWVSVFGKILVYNLKVKGVSLRLLISVTQTETVTVRSRCKF